MTNSESMSEQEKRMQRTIWLLAILVLLLGGSLALTIYRPDWYRLKANQEKLRITD